MRGLEYVGNKNRSVIYKVRYMEVCTVNSIWVIGSGSICKNGSR